MEKHIRLPLAHLTYLLDAGSKSKILSIPSHTGYTHTHAGRPDELLQSFFVELILCNKPVSQLKFTQTK